MTPESVMAIGNEAMKVALAFAAPLLLAALVSGLIVSLLQAATQINEKHSPSSRNSGGGRHHRDRRTVDAEPAA
jgi:hypothetical protein